VKPLVIASNGFNEIDQVESWFDNMMPIANGMLIVDSGSTDGTIDFFRKKAKDFPVVIIVDDIIQREGYGPARNHLRRESKARFPGAHWMGFFDFDERILPSDWHQLRWVKDNLIDKYDVIALPRIDWLDLEMTTMAKPWQAHPDWQARMTRLGSPIQYVRKLHEQITGNRGIFSRLTNPKINHFHRIAGQDKRDFIGKLCAKLHMEDDEFGGTYPMHHKEQHYRDLLKEEGLRGSEAGKRLRERLEKEGPT